jgi:hypothetical protein
LPAKNYAESRDQQKRKQKIPAKSRPVPEKFPVPGFEHGPESFYIHG